MFSKALGVSLTSLFLLNMSFMPCTEATKSDPGSEKSSHCRGEKTGEHTYLHTGVASVPDVPDTKEDEPPSAQSQPDESTNPAQPISADIAETDSPSELDFAVWPSPSELDPMTGFMPEFESSQDVLDNTDPALNATLATVEWDRPSAVECEAAPATEACTAAPAISTSEAPSVATMTNSAEEMPRNPGITLIELPEEYPYKMDVEATVQA